MSDQDTIGMLATQIGLALQPLNSAFELPDTFAAFMEDLGWNMDSVPPALSALAAPAAQIGSLLRGGELDSGQVPQLVAAVVNFVSAVSGVTSQPAGNFPAGLDVPGFKAEFPQQVIDYLIVEYLLRRQGAIGNLLKLAGIVRLEDVAASATRPAFVRRIVAWGDLGQFFSDPLLVLRNAYKWGQSDFKDIGLLQNVADALDAWHITNRFATIDPAMFSSLTAGALNPDNIFQAALQVPFFEELFSGIGGDVGLELLILPQTASQFSGFAILPYASGDLDEDISLTDDLSLHIRGQVQAAGGIAVVFRPNDPVTLSTGAPGVAADFSLGISTQSSTGANQLLLGSEGGSRLEYHSLQTTFGFRTDSKASSFYCEVALTGAALVVVPGSDADGFVANLLPSNLSVDANITIGLDSQLGVYFAGSGGLQIEIPAHISLGPIEIMSATIAVRVGGGEVPIDLGVTVQGNLGPLQAVIQNVGLTIPLSFPGQGGNIGPVNAGLKFKPPTGVGLSINAGIVTGGGFLGIGPGPGQYAGTMQLEIADFLSVSAIGLISTQMPDGTSGFSLLIIITADFGAGIQLSFGFTLLAVGGLIGLNRTMLFQPLMDGVRTGAVESIMFPRDVVANAPRIISDLSTIFPPQDGVFLIGPMAKVGWGTPTLISLSMAVIIEIPPGDAAILGILKMALPTEDIGILVLQVNFAGVLEFDKQRAYFFATLFDSHILFITITGGMGLLLAFGDDANFVVSVGGFHPQFNPPPLPFPAPDRIAVDLINESFARIHSDGYFAVTSNTVQFGAHSSFFFGFSACSVEGSSGIDVLIQISPFHFIGEISTQFSVKVFGFGVYGIGIDVTLSGPAPWHVHGTGSLSFFLFSVDIPIDFTWGDSPNSALNPVDIMPILTAEVQKNTNWKTQLPTNGQLLVSLRQLPPAEADMVLHPTGTLRVSQRTIPLDLQLDKVGSQAPKDANDFQLTVSGSVLTKTQDLNELFAPSQFRNFDDATKLSQPAFVPQHSGIELAGANGLGSATAITRHVRYDLTVIDSESKPIVVGFFPHSGVMFTAFLGGNSAAKSKLSAAVRTQTHPYKDAVQVSPEIFAVAFQSTNKAFHAEATAFASQASAQDYLAKAVANDPSLSGKLHVLPHFEVAA